MMEHPALHGIPSLDCRGVDGGRAAQHLGMAIRRGLAPQVGCQRWPILTPDLAAVAVDDPVEIQAVDLRFVLPHETGDIVDTLQDEELVDVEKREPRRLMLE